MGIPALLPVTLQSFMGVASYVKTTLRQHAKMTHNLGFLSAQLFMFEVYYKISPFT